MPTFGPIYCETPAFLSGTFPAEPINAFSNIAILVALAALYTVVRRSPRAYDLYFLCFLLFANGIGSLLWHGLRTRWALQVDVWPAVLFLLMLFLFGARRLFPIWAAFLIFAGFYVSVRIFEEIDIIPYGRWASIAPPVILLGGWLTLRTYSHSKRAALFCSIGLVVAFTGLFFRTIDGAACAHIPFGTHFLWHMLTATGAFLGMMALIELSRLENVHPVKVEPTD